ncbi:MAG: FG-GAP-like repeat-containing protein [Bacteroidota bacterium]
MKSIQVSFLIRVCVVLTLTTLSASAQSWPFTEIPASLPGVLDGSAEWGDYDNDGDLDILLEGHSSYHPTPSNPITRIYRNEGDGAFVEISVTLEAVAGGKGVWGDCDNDGDLDILLTGSSVTRVYRNDGGGAFVDISASLIGVATSGDWGDYDNDGDLDILLIGFSDAVLFSKVYRNDGGGNFQDISAALIGAYGCVAWGDYDNDSDLDILLSGAGISKVYRNDGADTFTDIAAPLAGLWSTSGAWGDYDNDGDLDILLTGISGSGTRISTIYRNDGGAFVDAVAPLVGVSAGSAAWGDYDNDGDLDIFITGDFGNYLLGTVYRNDGGGAFAAIGTLLPVFRSSAAWGDYDNDGDLDIVLTGVGTDASTNTRIFRNDIPRPNTASLAPTSLSSSISEASVLLSWNDAVDLETPQTALTYNIRLGTDAGEANVVSPMSEIPSGLRRLPALGNTNHNNTRTINGLTPGTYYWSVQAVDHGFAGGRFATEQSFSITGSVHHFSISSISSPQTVGSPFSITVTAQDADNNTVTDFTGTVDLATSAGTISPAVSGLFVSGQWASDVALSSASNGTTISVTRTGGTETGTSNPFDVNATLHHFAFSTIASPQTAGTPFSITITAQDRNNIIVTDFSGTVDLSTTAGTITPSISGAFVAGQRTESVSVSGSGFDKTVTATRTGGTESGTSNPFDVLSSVFTELASVTGGEFGAWGNIDNDDDPDMLITGNWFTNIFSNTLGSFTNINAGLLGLYQASGAWGDYDNDGDLDVVVLGTQPVAGEPRRTKLYRNNGGTFSEVVTTLPQLRMGTASWGDFDNDGDLDLAIGGNSSGTTRVCGIYRNDQGAFTDINAGIVGLRYPSIAWGDYDNDADLDLVITGEGAGDVPTTKLYRNDNGSFIEINAGLVNVMGSSAEWGDYDADGDIDLLLTGSSSIGIVAKVYNNNGGAFTDIGASLIGLAGGTRSAAWGDYDNDGDLDIALTGATLNVTKVYRNDGGSFADINATIYGLTAGSVAWGDYDNDGDLDLLEAGTGGPPHPIVAKIYRNNITTSNTVASAPQGLASNVSESTVTLSWSTSTDQQTSSDGLTYNLRVGTSPGGSQLIPPMAKIATGQRLIPAPGLTNANRTRLLKNLSPGTYYWSVQAIDNAFAGGPFSTEQSFTVVGPVHHFAFSLIAGPQTAGQPFSVSITAQDINNNTVTDFTGTVDFTTTAGVTAPLVSGAFVSGQWSANVSVSTDGVGCTITATRTGGTETGTSNKFDVVLPLFTDINAGLTGVLYSSAAWGDYDNDGDLDILLIGSDLLSIISRVYQNNGNNTFTDVNAGLTGGSGTWGDYDNDGDLDILVTGLGVDGPFSKVYRNDGNSAFTDINALLAGVSSSSAAWGDFDNDGDLDILLSGYNSPGIFVSKVYRNNGNNTFTDINVGLPGLMDGSVALGDYDNDGDLDILLTGVGYDAPISGVYRNNGNSTFTNIGAGLASMTDGSVAWGDFDNDGDLDILLTGEDFSAGSISKVYRNNGNSTFTDINAGLAAVQFSAAAWGDYDNDGNLDILLTGMGNNLVSRMSRVYRNQNGEFVDIGANLPDVQKGSVAWGDYDNDGDLDILLTGEGTSGIISKVYRNNSSIANTEPGASASLTATPFGGETVALAWSASTDGQTPADGLSYNLRVGTTPGSSNILGPMANTTNGYRRVPKVGPQQILHDTLTLPAGTYYWSVQAIDNAFAGGPFASEQQFTINTAPVALNDSFVVDEDDTLIVAAPGVLGNDTNTTALTAALVTGVSHGSLSLNTDGSFIYIPLPNFSGSDSFVYLANDGSLTDTAMACINVGPVNDPPSFAIGSDQTIPKDAGAQTVAGWATGISPGPSDESGQALTFLLSNNNNALFAVQPDVDEATGTLTYTPAPGLHGSATVTVTLRDSGGIANGGDDESDPQTFTITISNVIGPVHHFVLSAIGSPQTAGTPFSVAITALDSQGDTATDFTGTVDLTTNAGIIAPVVSGAFVNGGRTEMVRVTQAGSDKLVTATVTGGTQTGASNTFEVVHGALHHYAFAAITSPKTAGVPFDITIIAQDSMGNTVMLPDTVSLTTTAGTITPNISTPLDAGQTTASVRITLADTGRTVTARKLTGTRSGTSNAFAVVHGPLHHFAFGEIGSPKTSGVAFDITLVAQDEYNNTARSFVETVALSTSAGPIIPVVSGAFTNGIVHETVRITGTGNNQTIVATRTGGTETGTSNGFDLIQTALAGVLLNPCFETGKTPWVFYTNGSATFTSDAPGCGTQRKAHVAVATQGTNVQLYQSGIALQPSQLYRLSFRAYSSTGHDLSVSLGKHAAPYTPYGLSDVVLNLTTDWQEFSIEFTTSGFTSPVTDGRLRFWFAPYDAGGDHFYVDTVMLSPVTTSLPPSITGQPSDRTVVVGQTASFSVTATGSLPLIYQWKRNGLNIPGATSSTYTIPSVATGDSGAVFTCVVSNLSGSITSNGALLTVISAPSNAIVNGGFEEGIAPWTFHTNGSGTFALVAPGAGGSTNAARMSITTQGTNVHVEFTPFNGQ